MTANGPYIITTRREGRLLGREHDATYSRRAVATLEEAREAAHLKVAGWDRSQNGQAHTLHIGRMLRAALTLPESGGTVGPLPDETVIEVEPLSWADLRERAGLDRDGFTFDRVTLATYNANQEADRAR